MRRLELVRDPVNLLVPSVSVTALPDTATASTVRAEPATDTANDDDTGCDAVSSASPKVSVSTAPSTDALDSTGAMSSASSSRTTSAASTGLAPSVK